MDVTQRQIVEVRALDLLLRDRVIFAPGACRVAVQHHEVKHAVVRRGKALQQRPTVCAHKARAPDAAVFFRQREAGNLLRRKNMYVFRPIVRQIRAARGKIVVVARREKDLGAQTGQRAGQRRDRLGIRVIRVKEIAREQHEIARVRIRRVGERLQKLQLLFAPDCRLRGAERGEGRIEVQIGRVQKFYHSAITLSTPTHRRVLVSMVNSAPHRRHLPGATSKREVSSPRNIATDCSGRTPMTECTGPVMPRSV